MVRNMVKYGEKHSKTLCYLSFPPLRNQSFQHFGGVIKNFVYPNGQKEFSANNSILLRNKN
jgi:hypothetical protein